MEKKTLVEASLLTFVGTTRLGDNRTRRLGERSQILDEYTHARRWKRAATIGGCWACRVTGIRDSACTSNPTRKGTDRYALS